MSEQIPNTECRICGKEYYACRKCDELNHWKSVACCPQHYAEYVEVVTKIRNKTIEKELIEIETKNKDKVVETLSKKKSKPKNISEKAEL